MICVKASCNHPFAEKELTFEQLKDEAFVLPSVGNGMRDLYERCCKKHGMKPNVAIECNERQCLHHYISANMALTLGSYRALSDQTQNDIIPLKVLDFNETQSVYVFYKNTPNIDIHIKEFCDFLYCYSAFCTVSPHHIFNQIKIRYTINYSDREYIRLIYAVPFVLS